MPRVARRFLSGLLLGFVCLAPLAARAAEPPSRTFRLTYAATVRDIPADARTLALWVPWPQTDARQTIHRVTIESEHPVTIGREPRVGNAFASIQVDRPRTDVTIRMTITATRLPDTGSAGTLTAAERAAYLAAEPLVPLDGPVRALAAEATRGQSTDAEKARAIYDTVVARMTYDKTGIGWGRGDAVFACEAKRGNCTDFHALIIGMARASGIPARFVMGLPLPERPGSGTIPGYHCWAELYLEEAGWIPVDASEAAKHPAQREFFFGHLDANRLEFSRGRHLTLEPPQSGPPLNFFIDPYAEVDGKPHAAVDHAYTYEDVAAAPSTVRETP